MNVCKFEDPWGNDPSKDYKKKPKADYNNLNLNELLANFERKFGGLFSFGGNKQPRRKLSNKFILFIGFIIISLWLVSGFYIINPEEEGVELIFGKYHDTSSSGLRYNFPYPIGSVNKVKVATINKEEIGYTGYKSEGEGIMLTGDENVVNVNFEVQWRIKNAYDFLYKVNDNIQGLTVKSAAESAMRDSIAQNKIGFILRGEGRAQIMAETRNLLQKILDGYNMGIEILSIQMKKVDPPEKVISAFRDVQSARADKERAINEAYTYQNDILPRAQGEAARISKDADAYKIEVINRAEGDTKRFADIYAQYKNNKNITMERMYLESMEEIYKGAEKIILDNNSQALPLLDLMRQK